MVIIDTDVIIDHLRLSGRKDSLLETVVRKHPKESLAISMITIQELYEGKSTRDEQKEQYLLATISPLKILPYTYEVAQKAGEIARDRKDSIEFTDAAIAATAIINGFTLLTLNKKHFKGIEDLVQI